MIATLGPLWTTQVSALHGRQVGKNRSCVTSSTGWLDSSSGCTTDYIATTPHLLLHWLNRSVAGSQPASASASQPQQLRGAAVGCRRRPRFPPPRPPLTSRSAAARVRGCRHPAAPPAAPVASRAGVVLRVRSLGSPSHALGARFWCKGFVSFCVAEIFCLWRVKKTVWDKTICCTP